MLLCMKNFSSVFGHSSISFISATIAFIFSHLLSSDFFSSGLLLSEGCGAILTSLTQVGTSVWRGFLGLGVGVVFRFLRQVVWFLAHIQLSSSIQSLTLQDGKGWAVPLVGPCSPWLVLQRNPSSLSGSWASSTTLRRRNEEAQSCPNSNIWPLSPCPQCYVPWGPQSQVSPKGPIILLMEAEM